MVTWGVPRSTSIDVAGVAYIEVGSIRPTRAPRPASPHPRTGGRDAALHLHARPEPPREPRVQVSQFDGLMPENVVRDVRSALVVLARMDPCCTIAVLGSLPVNLKR